MSEIHEIYFKVVTDEIDKAVKAYQALKKSGTDAMSDIKKAIIAEQKAVKASMQMRKEMIIELGKQMAAEKALSQISSGKGNKPGAGGCSPNDNNAVNVAASAALHKPTSSAYADELMNKLTGAEKELEHSFASNSAHLNNLMKDLNIGSTSFAGTIITGLTEAESIFKDIVGVINSIQGISKSFGAIGDIISLLGFDSGGFTGYGRSHEIAGLVHKGEYVWDQKTTEKYMPLLQAIHLNKFDNSPLSPLKAVSLSSTGNTLHHSALNTVYNNSHISVNNPSQYIPLSRPQAPVIHVHISGAMDGQTFLDKNIHKWNNTQTLITAS